MKRFHATCLCGPGCQLAMGQATPAKVGWSRQKWLGVSKPSQRSLVRTLQQMWAAGPVREAARHRLPPPHYVVQPAVTRTTTRMQRPLQSFQAAPENSPSLLPKIHHATGHPGPRHACITACKASARSASSLLAKWPQAASCCGVRSFYCQGWGQVRQEWASQQEKEKVKEGTSKEDERRAAKAEQEQVRSLLHPASRRGWDCPVLEGRGLHLSCAPLTPSCSAKHKPHIQGSWRLRSWCSFKLGQIQLMQATRGLQRERPRLWTLTPAVLHSCLHASSKLLGCCVCPTMHCH